jgi:hypothetical protein
MMIDELDTVGRMNNGRKLKVSDPFVMFASGAFIGIALGPQIVRAVGGILKTRAQEALESFTDRRR